MTRLTESINCPSCGAPLKKGRDSCEFCGGSIVVHQPGNDKKHSYALMVTQFDYSLTSKKLIKKLFRYYVAGWVDQYFSTLPAIIQVDTSKEKLQALQHSLEKVFKEKQAGISLAVIKYHDRLPLENRHCRRLLGDRLDDYKIRRRKSALSPTAIAVIFMALLLPGSIAVLIVKNMSSSSYDPEAERIAIGSAVTPEATAILKDYGSIIKGSIRSIDVSLYPPGEIRITGSSLLESIYIDLDYKTKKVKTISLDFNTDFDSKKYERFSSLFTSHTYGGGKTVSGNIIKKTNPETSPDGTIVHKEFSVNFSDRHDPQEYMDYLFKRGDYDEDKPGRDEIIDENDLHKENKRAGKKPPVIGKQVKVTFASFRNSLSREVFTGVIDALKVIIE